MKRPLLTTVLLATSWAGAMIAAEPGGVATSQPLEQLRSVREFAFGGIGFAGTPAPGEVALRGIMGRPDAAAVLAAIAAEGTPEARCYALAGLFMIAPGEAFEAHAARFRANAPEHVRTMHGCLMASASGLAILAEIEAGRYAAFFAQISAD